MVDLELTVRNRDSAVETLLSVGSPDRNFLGLTKAVITHGCSEAIIIERSRLGSATKAMRPGDAGHSK